MYKYLKKTLMNMKTILVFLLIFSISIYNFSIAESENYIRFDIYDMALGYFGRIGALLLAYLLILSILINYYDKNYIIIRFENIEKWRISIIKNQIFLAIIFAVVINVIPSIYICAHSYLISSYDWQAYLIVNTATQAAAFIGAGFMATFLYFKILNLKVSVLTPFIVYNILNLIDNFLLNRYLNISACFAIPAVSSGLTIFETLRKSLIFALTFYLINVSIKKKRDMYNFEE